jgi:hypothetical protein
MLAGGSTVKADEFDDAKAVPPEVVPESETAYWLGEVTLTEEGTKK